jgi:hypothetical protein
MGRLGDSLLIDRDSRVTGGPARLDGIKMVTMGDEPFMTKLHTGATNTVSR